MFPQVKLKPHQEVAVNKMRDGCVLNGGVGSGKTYTALFYYKKYHWPKQVVVITTAKKRDDKDWDISGVRLGISTHEDSSQYGYPQMIVDSWNNIKKYADKKDCFFIFDEQRLVGKGVWVKTFYKIAKQNKWILLSATPGDTWSDYIPVFIANGFYKNRTEFNDRHVVFRVTKQGWPLVDRYIATKRLRYFRDKILVNMPYERHTTRHEKVIQVGYDFGAVKELAKTRWNTFEDKPIESPPEFVSVMRRIIYSHPDRLKALQELLRRHERLIVFYNYDFELEALRSLFRASKGVSVAEWNGHRHEPVPETKSWVYLVNYMSGAEAWECITTDTIVYFSQTPSYRQKEQSMGRIDRMNTPYINLFYYTLRSRAPYELHMAETVAAKKDFNDSAWYKQFCEK